MNETAHRLEERRRETLDELDLVQELITELDDLSDVLRERVIARPLEFALELRDRLRQRECEIAIDQLVCATASHRSATSGETAAAPRARLTTAPVAPGPPPPAVTDPLEARAARIDPRTAICFNGYYAEDFGDGPQCSRALVWVSDEFDTAPDWAMRDAWPELDPVWTGLLDAAWARCHPRATDEGAA